MFQTRSEKQLQLNGKDDKIDAVRSVEKEFQKSRDVTSRLVFLF